MFRRRFSVLCPSFTGLLRHEYCSDLFIANAKQAGDVGNELFMGYYGFLFTFLIRPSLGRNCGSANATESAGFGRKSSCRPTKRSVPRGDKRGRREQIIPKKQRTGAKWREFNDVQV